MEIFNNVNQNLKSLNELLVKQHSNIFNVTNENIIVDLKNRIDLSIPLFKPCDADGLTELFERELSMHILFATKGNRTETYNVVGFSAPSADKMCLFYIKSKEFGVVKNVFFVIYSSMEEMLAQLQRLGRSINQTELRLEGITVLEQMPEVELVKIFTSPTVQ